MNKQSIINDVIKRVLPIYCDVKHRLYSNIEKRYIDEIKNIFDEMDSDDKGHGEGDYIDEAEKIIKKWDFIDDITLVDKNRKIFSGRIIKAGYNMNRNDICYFVIDNINDIEEFLSKTPVIYKENCNEVFKTIDELLYCVKLEDNPKPTDFSNVNINEGSNNILDVESTHINTNDECSIDELMKIINTITDCYKKNPNWTKTQVEYIKRKVEKKYIIDKFSEKHEVENKQAWNAVDYFTDLLFAPISMKNNFFYQKSYLKKNGMKKGKNKTIIDNNGNIIDRYKSIIGYEQAITIVSNKYGINKNELKSLYGKINQSKRNK